VLGCLIPLWLFSASGGQEKPRTGPETEKRFPPLKVPPGFKATLFACDPLIEYPSVIAAGPKANSLFVAIDYVTGLGEEIVRRDEVRLVEDTDGDGYADKSTVYATGFNSVQGLAYHDGNVYVMHAPFLTVLRDTKGAGAADERRDLLKGLGLAPEVNKTRLHCANGVAVGHDGWLYLAMGDNGTDVIRPEGDRLVLNGGGVLRCRPDGRDLHVFATGLRNIYDVALDAELNVFVRDNENDGGAYKIRVCHSFFGADHGYPYHYFERPDEALPPLADLGLGSSAGGVCYLERGLPAEYRGNLFFCEWGRSVVRYAPTPAGSGFGPVKETEFAAAAENDPYGFKPTDIVVQRGGALMISDWADGQRPKRGRGRIYRVTAAGVPETIEKPATGLDSESYYERCDTQLGLEKQGGAGSKAVRQLLADGKLSPRGRGHALWVVAHNDGPKALGDLLAVAKLDPDPGVRVQAVRVIADLADPVLAKGKLDAGPGDEKVAAKLAALGEGADARLRREVIVALGRLQWAGTPDWVAKHVTKPDEALAHAAIQALRRAGNWPAVLKLLDRPTGDAVRSIALRAVADRHEAAVVDGLIERLKAERVAPRRQAYADALSRVYRKPGPWVYWGYRPGPRPANAVDWERTTVVAAALDRALADPDRGVRLAVLKRMQREKVPVRTTTLTKWLGEEQGEEVVAVLLESLDGVPAAESRSALLTVVGEKQYGPANRLRALAILTAGFDATGAEQLIPLARGLEDGPVLAEVLRLLGRYPKLGGAAALLASRTASKVAAVRAAAVEALAELGAAEGKEPALTLLGDGEAAVRRAAAGAAGKLGVAAAVEPLLKLAKDANPGVRAASLDALRRLKEPRVVPLAVAALDDRLTQLAALECLHALGGPEQGAAVLALARRAPPADVLAVAVRSLSAWSGRDGIAPAKRRELESAIAAVHGATGTLLRWEASRALTVKEAATVAPQFALPGATPGPNSPPVTDWRSVLAAGAEWRVSVGPAKGEAADAVWLAFADVAVPETAAVEFIGSGGALEVWLNGKSLYRVEKPPASRTAPVRFAGELAKGGNRVLVRVGSPAAEFSLGFRRKSGTPAHERLTQAALTRTGDIERGRKVFLHAEKSLCVKCHRVGDTGERIGPELTGIGARFGRVYLVESILDPNRAVVPGFATVRVELKDGRVFTGVKVAETDTALTLADTEAKKHELMKGDIQEQRPAGVSTMPEGAEKRLTEQEFIDLVAYLVSLKDRKN
jgi:putative membrane-bound dehydrogenase-like protein